MSAALKTPESPIARRGTHCVQRLVELSRCAAMVFERFGVDCQAASPRKSTTMACMKNTKYSFTSNLNPQPHSGLQVSAALHASKCGPKPVAPPGIRTTARDYANPVDYKHPYPSMAQLADLRRQSDAALLLPATAAHSPTFPLRPLHDH